VKCRLINEGNATGCVCFIYGYRQRVGELTDTTIALAQFLLGTLLLSNVKADPEYPYWNALSNDRRSTSRYRECASIAPHSLNLWPLPRFINRWSNGFAYFLVCFRG